jgi:hypothetical protein
VGDTPFVPVARFLQEAEALALAGRLRAEDIDARVAPQGDSLYPYRGHLTPGAVFQVIVPEALGARARWLIEAIEREHDRGDAGDGWSKGP